MRYGDISNSTEKRLWLIADGFLFDTDSIDARRFDKTKRRAARDVVINPDAVGTINRLLWSRNLSLGLATFVDPAAREVLVDKVDVLLGMPLLWFSSPNDFLSSLYRPAVWGVCDVDPIRRLSFGNLGVPLEPGHMPLGL